MKTAEGYQVDFLARLPDGTEILAQVRTSIDDDETRLREVRALNAAAVEYPNARRLLLALESRTPFPKVPRDSHVPAAGEWMFEA